MIYAAIDPGDSTGFAVITGEKTVMTASTTPEIFDLLGRLNKFKQHELIIGIENVHALWGVAAKSTFSFGRELGYWLGILDYLQIPPVKIQTKLWQDTTMLLPKRPDIKGLTKYQARKAKDKHKDAIKLASIAAAKAAFPNAHIPNHNVADAINMARYLKHRHELQG